MSRCFLPLAFALLAWPLAASAEDPKTQATPATPAPPPPPPYELKNRSAFGSPGTALRPPFWPIGWVHRDNASPMVAAIPVAVKVTLDQNYFKVTSILLGSGTTPSLAVINGRAYSEGEFVRMPKTPGTAPIRVRVQRINDGAVVLQHADQTMIAGLRREELPNKRDDEKLLDLQDR